MNNKDTLRELMNDWLTSHAKTADWDRSINPPGDELRIEQGGPNFLVLDSAIEDNSTEEIVDALQRACGGLLGRGGRFVLKNDLTWEPR